MLLLQVQAIRLDMTSLATIVEKNQPCSRLRDSLVALLLVVLALVLARLLVIFLPIVGLPH